MYKLYKVDEEHPYQFIYCGKFLYRQEAELNMNDESLYVIQFDDMPDPFAEIRREAVDA